MHKMRRTGKTRLNLELYVFFLIPSLVCLLVFQYLPMYGVQIAFRTYIPTKGFLGSPWAGLRHFHRFFESYQFWNLLKNTLGISLYQLLAGFPLPIILALMLNQVGNQTFKRFTQTITYAPHFISVVVLVGLLNVFLSPRTGLFNLVLRNLGGEPIYFLGKSSYFWSLYVLSGIWQSTGWAAIIYLAALSTIDPALYDAAKMDGTTRFQRIRHIDLPGILPTVIILFILNTGRLMSVGFEKTFLMQNVLNLEASEVISTYVYKVGLLNSQFSFASAVGLFNGGVNLAFLWIVNQISKRVSSVGLF